jgi:hypothetical protein
MSPDLDDAIQKARVAAAAEELQRRERERQRAEQDARDARLWREYEVRLRRLGSDFVHRAQNARIKPETIRFFVREYQKTLFFGGTETKTEYKTVRGWAVPDQLPAYGEVPTWIYVLDDGSIVTGDTSIYGPFAENRQQRPPPDPQAAEAAVQLIAAKIARFLVDRRA